MTKLIHLFELPTVSDDGKLTIGQQPNIPFDIKRFYYIYDCVPNLLRGAHAHHETRQILFCLRGSVRMVLDDGKNKEEIILDKPNVGILLDKLIWHDMCDIKEDTFMLVIASLPYSKEDYIRDYKEFKRISNGK
jgi:dTDP-4-dehydrorhamnose 3,5-epimerase-like enzyme